MKKLDYADKPDYDYIKNIYIQGMKSDHFDPVKFNWSEFISNHSNMDKFEKIVTMCTLKVINRKNRERKEQLMNQEVNSQENKTQNQENSWHCLIE